DLLRVRREDKPPPPPRSKFCPGCYSPLSKPGEPARARRQVENKKRRRLRPKPTETWRPGIMIPLSKELVRLQGMSARDRGQV
ncbi:hypothetical protein G0U57_021233, partial [Chelydra serpentina]